MATRGRLIGSVVSAGALSVLGLAAALLGTRQLLGRQAAVARGLIGKPHGDQAPDADKVYRKRYGDRIELLLVGDSIAAGLGADLPK
jgi:hypothetical protein